MLKKPRSRFLRMSFAGLAVLFLVLAACSTGTTTPSGNTPTTSSGTPVKGGTWIDDLYEEPDSLITNASSETFSDMVDQTIYAPLFYGDANGILHPGLATELPTVANGGASADFKTWTIHLRSGLKWSDGQPLDARDVDFTWRLWTNPKFTAASTIGYNLITGADVSSDNLSITFHLKSGYGDFVALWADGLNAPLPAHHYQGISPDKLLTTSDNLDPSVTSGPFMMSESKPGDHYTVVRNPDYYLASQGFPYLNSIVFRIVTNQDTILKDLQSGSIDSSWFLDVTKTIAYQQLTNYKLAYNPKATNFEAMYLDYRNPILGTDSAVRQAMAMAIDHGALIDTARRGFASPLCTDHSAGLVPGYQANAACPKFDPAAANKLLDQDGWSPLVAGQPRHKGSEILSFEYSSTANNLWRADDELILQQDFAAIGVQIQIENYPASTFFGPFLGKNTPSPATGAQSGRYDLAEFENSFTYTADDSSILACSQFPPAGSNFSYYCNKNLDALFPQEQASGDPTVQQNVFNQIHQIELTDFPFITLYSPVDLSMHKLTVNNYTPAPEGASETINNWEWWCNGGQC
ncbi:MAG TPA: peptide ABC transporter substrate-binding protein [Ktedonobacteraceae bacterium]|nr:peptide ABC transporter substrate-binding protein [Ktedonobacteraceae bacterium]